MVPCPQSTTLTLLLFFLLLSSSLLPPLSSSLFFLALSSSLLLHSLTPTNLSIQHLLNEFLLPLLFPFLCSSSHLASLSSSLLPPCTSSSLYFTFLLLAPSLSSSLLHLCPLSLRQIFASRISGWKGGERKSKMKGRIEEWEGVSGGARWSGEQGSKGEAAMSELMTEKGSEQVSGGS
jgi:hypothetical protein